MTVCENRVPGVGGARAFGTSVTGWGPMHVTNVGALHATMHRTKMADLRWTLSGCLFSVRWLCPWSVLRTGPGGVGHVLGHFVGGR